MTEIWSQLLSTALVGTQRRPAAITPLDDPFSTVVRPSIAADGPGGLLDTAAALTVLHRAGLRPTSGVTRPPVAPAESLRPAPPAAVNRLIELADDNGRLGYHGEEARVALMDEWFSLAAARGYRLPGHLLPTLFAQARRRVAIRPALMAAGGERARWLAAARPEWSWLLEVATAGTVTTAATLDERLWHEGGTGERVDYLTALRAHDPAAAREQLRAVWATEGPAERAALLATLATGLGLADEEFCEQALDDRRKEVRTVASDLLARLDGSAYQARMAQRALACVAVGVRGRLVITPPAECDQAMRRDGVEARAPQGTGERAWWFAEVVARAPLSAWSTLDAEPAALLARKVDDDWQVTLHRGWARAAIAQRASAWASALVDAGFGRRRDATGPDRLLSTSLFGVISPEDAVRRAATALRERNSQASDLLAACPRPWPDVICAEVLDAVTIYAKAKTNQRIGQRWAIAEQAGLAMPPQYASIARERAAHNRENHPDDTDQSMMDRLVDVLTLRYEMHQELA